MKKLTGKISVNGTIQALTGLHIGGNKSSLEIGGVDLNVIKSGKGVPYIPGSSLKGKLRSLLGKVRGSNNVNEDDQDIKDLFGDGGGNDKNKEENSVKGTTRLFVRDAILDTNSFLTDFGNKEDRAMDFEYSEVKTENTIIRSRGTAQHPRQIERVPADAIFKFDIMMDVYQDDNMEHNLKLLREALQLLNMDYLGGHGSRGSGKVAIVVNDVSGKTFNNGITSMDPTGIKEIFADLMTIQST